MGRARGRNHTRPGGFNAEKATPEEREIGQSALQDPAGSPIPGLTGNIVNYATQRQAVPVGEPMDQFRGMMAHGVPHELDTTEERAQAERGGPNVARTRPVPAEKPRELPPPVPVYIVEFGGGNDVIRSASPRHLTVANSASDATRLGGRNPKRNRIGLLNEDGTTDVRFAVTPRDLNNGGGAFLPHSQTSYLWLETQDEIYAVTTSSTLSVTVSVIEEFELAM